jgi:HEAT repeat protein
MATLTVDESNISKWIQDLDSLDFDKRQEAKDHLQELGTAVIEPLIAAANSLTPRKCWEAIASLVKIDDPRVGPAMCELLLSRHPIVAPIAARALARCGEQFVDVLLAALPHSRALTQVEMVTELEGIGARRAVLPLMNLLRKTDSSVLRYTIIQALGKLGDARATELIRSFQHDEDHHVRKRVHIAPRSLENASDTRDLQHDT